ncbi:flagellin, partial [Aliarcobacter skirrowii]|uniref:flagellin N-terminal helical domain-containing protein n=1 Tax=Aliarcobacter skirrowii TaxID=28200 RepID=UPI002A365F92
MRINTNVSSLTAQEAATNTNNSIKNSLEKLSTGLKINKASDDASGLAIADKLRTQVTSINQGIANGNSAISLLQIADKSMAEQSRILDTVKAKLIQASTDTTSTAGRVSIAKDVSKLLTQLNNIAGQTNYNGTYLLQASGGTGTAASAQKGALTFQIGEKIADTISTDNIRANTAGYGLTTLSAAVANTATFSVDQAAAKAGQTAVDAAITTLN